MPAASILLFVLLSILLTGCSPGEIFIKQDTKDSLQRIDFIIGVSNDLNFNEQWHYTISDIYPHLSGTDTVYQNQYFMIYVLFGDYGTKKDSTVKLEYDIEIIKPNGNTFFSQNEIDAYQGKVSYPLPMILSEANIKMVIDSNQPLGRYQVRIKGKDRIKKKNLLKSIDINLLEYKYHDSSPFKSNEDFLNWIKYYYEKPQPVLGVEAFKYYVNSDLLQIDSIFNPMFHFFQILFINNQFLIPHLLNQYKTSSTGQKGYITFLLRSINYDTNVLKEYIPKDEFLIYDSLSKVGIHNPFIWWLKEINTDLIVYTFYYDGSYQMIKALVTAMWSKNGGHFPDKFGDCPQCVGDKQKLALANGDYYKITSNSLLSLFRAHDLVRNYCYYIYKMEKDINPTAREELGNILSIK